MSSRIASRRSLLAAAIPAAALLVAAAGPVAASAPLVFTRTDHVFAEGYFHCGPADAGFDVAGDWDIADRLTLFLDGAGTPVSDIEHVSFAGAWVNQSSGARTPDHGTIVYFDTLNPDGSFATTIRNAGRGGRYIHGGGRLDFQDGSYHGADAEQPDNVDALCAALAG